MAESQQTDRTGEQGWQLLHDEAVRQGRDTYLDPETGYEVFTAAFHRRRGVCCGSGCRHCPYDSD